MYAVLMAAIAWARAREEFSRPGAGLRELFASQDAEKALEAAVNAWDAPVLDKKNKRLLHIVKKASKGAVTTQELGRDLGVCDRTIYRDVRTLQEQGVPIVGEAGMGYMICKKGERYGQQARE